MAEQGAPWGGQIPGRQDLDPGDTVEFLPCFVLFDVERQAARLCFRHRLTGTHIVDLLGRDVTDPYIEDASARKRAAVVAARFEGVVLTKQPGYSISPVPVVGREFLKYGLLTVPLASDGGRSTCCPGFAARSGNSSEEWRRRLRIWRRNAAAI